MVIRQVQENYPDSLKEDSTVQYVFSALSALDELITDLVSSKNDLISKVASSNTPAQGGVGVRSMETSLIALHCGHNGWPAHEDLYLISSFMKSVGVI